MAPHPYGDDGHIRHLPHRRRRHPDPLRDLSDMSAAIANLTGPVGGPAAKTHGALCSNTFKEM
jgi:hypothetical protein